ncbi:MAG: hypothetical protein K8S87_06570 [Planctomycetes bacterium]|nr:hypothetical protein [Planctomycetota bacterium]
MKTPALFIDIDRVLIRDIETRENIDCVRLIRSAGKALSEINSLSIPVISILKLPKEYFSNNIINKTVFEKELKRKFTRYSAKTDALYFSEHCVKTNKNAVLAEYEPDTSIFLDAANRFNMDLKKCLLVTDCAYSLLSAKSLEMFGTILISTCKGKNSEMHFADEKIDLKSMNVEVFSSFNIARSVLKKSFKQLLEDKSESIEPQKQEVLQN